MTGDSSPPILRIRNLTKRRGDRTVLTGVSLQLRRRDVAVLIGPSGAGKSTVLRCVNGLESFDDGEVCVDETLRISADQGRHEREKTFLQIRRRVGMVFQQFNLFPHLSALANVALAPIHVLKKPRPQAESEARTLLDRVGLGTRLDSLPSQLSGGQQQRVAIARTLAMKPEIILFDEPTSALDPQMTSEVLAVINDLAADGQTMMVVTHAMHFARRAATTIHVLCDGQLAESGSAEQIFSNPNHPATCGLLRQAGST